MSFANEFRQFAMRGNVMDMAVGIIIGGAFGKIVSSLVSDVIMPPIGMLVGGVNFTGIKIPLSTATEAAPAVTLNIGMFLQTVFDFLIVAFAIFMIIKMMNNLKKKEEAAPVAPAKPSNQEVLLGEIRDLLRKGSGNAGRAA